MKTKRYLKHLLSLAIIAIIVFVCIKASAQIRRNPGFKGIEVSEGKITILLPKVYTVITPNPSNAGAATIAVDATPSVIIFDAVNLVSTQTINGGITLISSTLDSGIHFIPL